VQTAASAQPHLACENLVHHDAKAARSKTSHIARLCDCDLVQEVPCYRYRWQSVCRCWQLACVTHRHCTARNLSGRVCTRGQDWQVLTCASDCRPCCTLAVYHTLQSLVPHSQLLTVSRTIAYRVLIIAEPTTLLPSCSPPVDIHSRGHPAILQQLWRLVCHCSNLHNHHKRHHRISSNGLPTVQSASRRGSSAKARA
jgi:hypothetical protein